MNSRNKQDIMTTVYTIQSLTNKKRRSARKFAESIFKSGVLPLSLTGDYDLVWDVSDLDMSIQQYNDGSQADRRNTRIITTLLEKRGIDASSKEIKAALKVLVQQYSIKASVIVQWIVSNCIKVRKSLCPKYINAKCREVLAKEIVTYEQIYNPLSRIIPAGIV